MRINTSKPDTRIPNTRNLGQSRLTSPSPKSQSSKQARNSSVMVARPKRMAKAPARQEGMALAISLILLVAMTIVGIATMSGTRLNEKITSNSQQKAISFEAAESSIGTVWTVDDLLESVDEIPDGVFNNPDKVAPDGLASLLSADFDQTNANGVSVDIDAAVTIQFCGETSLHTGTSLSADESKLQMAGAVFDVNGVASIAGSKARSDHLQRGYIIRPKTGRTGACVTPGV